MDATSAVQLVGQAIDGGGVAVIVVGAALSLRSVHRGATAYRLFREQLGRAILLGLELLVAGDIVRTVAATPTLKGLAVLAGIIVIRTFLSFTLELEISGRWPWQAERPRMDRSA